MKPTQEQIKTDESVWPEGATHYTTSNDAMWPWLNENNNSFFRGDEWIEYPSLIEIKDHLIDAIPRPTKAFVPEVECKTIYWVAEVDNYGTPWNFDGPHDSYDDAESSIPLLLEIGSKNRNLIVTSMKFRPIKSERELLIDIIEATGSMSNGVLADNILNAGFIMEPTK